MPWHIRFLFLFLFYNVCIKKDNKCVNVEHTKMSYIYVIKVIGKNKPDAEKLSAYECGFDAFDDARNKFDVRFYLVAILFIIFDLEVAFLFPWAVSLGEIGIFGFWSMVVFLGVLTVGLIYEWNKGALDWE